MTNEGDVAAVTTGLRRRTTEFRQQLMDFLDVVPDVWIIRRGGETSWPGGGSHPSDNATGSTPLGRAHEAVQRTAGDLRGALDRLLRELR